ncbi:hypothetical protein SAMN06269185_1061 [Natronoarchaeum philippinense]|uniref:Uncharacterized protein n=1 Tax=Natronoarchaeum philippinense TaxID=558529 RepID=A0A285N9F2_NATPI|nr:hypothetical protein [Natronoarchaeum philippinense]SNZ06134.1 hypothetical protein SAMN06269185_1061 [Natronoarchaeum philippinense]
MTDDEHENNRAARMVYDALEEMHRRRREYWRSKSVGAVTKNLQAALQGSVVDVHDELRPHKHKVDEQWDEHNLDALPELAQSKIRDPSVSTKGGRVTVSQSTKPYRIQCRRLVRWSWALDEIARDLGFEAPTKEETPSDEADLDDLAWLLHVRGQDEALERLPDDYADKFRTDFEDADEEGGEA